MSERSISINQRIPLATLEIALISYLENNYSNEYIIEQLRLEFDGENRIKKALDIIGKMILRSPIDKFIVSNKDALLAALKNKADRNIILIALLNAAYPFSFDVLRTFGKYFSVQSNINTSAIIKTVSLLYGGNRSTENAIYSVVPMFIEANLFQRKKMGVYSFDEKQNLISEISRSIYKESLKLFIPHFDNSLQIRDPYFYFIAQ